MKKVKFICCLLALFLSSNAFGIISYSTTQTSITAQDSLEKTKQTFNKVDYKEIDIAERLLVTSETITTTILSLFSISFYLRNSFGLETFPWFLYLITLGGFAIAYILAIIGLCKTTKDTSREAKLYGKIFVFSVSLVLILVFLAIETGFL